MSRRSSTGDRLAGLAGAGWLAGLGLACHGIPHDGLPVTAQRPTLSSDTATTAEGSFEVEAGVSVADGGDGGFPASLKYGVSSTAEVFASWSPYVEIDSERGVGDVRLGLRYRFLEEEDSVPSLAVQSILEIPTADEDDGLGSGEPDLLLAGIATKSVYDWAVTGFAELDLLGDPDGGVRVGQSLALAVARSLPDQFGVFGELAGVFVPEDDSALSYTTVGLTYNPQRYLVFDLGVSVGLDEDAEDYILSLGLTQNLGSPGTAPLTGP